jgi:hypothetical protein
VHAVTRPVGTGDPGDDARMGPTLTFRATSSKAYAVVAWAACAAVLVAITTNGGAAELGQYGAVPLALAAAAWAVFWEPHVTISPDGVTVANVWRTVQVPWGAVERVESRWGLRLHTPRGRVDAWATPARGKLAMSRRPSVPDAHLDPESSVHRNLPGDAELVARVIETRLLAGADDAGTVVARPNWRTVVVVLGAIALAVATVSLLG